MFITAKQMHATTEIVNKYVIKENTWCHPRNFFLFQGGAILGSNQTSLVDNCVNSLGAITFVSVQE